MSSSRKFDCDCYPHCHQTMSRIPFVCSFVVSLLTLIHLHRIARSVSQPPTTPFILPIQYVLPCKVCTNALLNAMESPSRYTLEFMRKAHVACNGAARNKTEKYACLSLLMENSRSFVKDQINGEPVHQSCAATSATTCMKHTVIVICNHINDGGECRMISFN